METRIDYMTGNVIPWEGRCPFCNVVLVIEGRLAMDRKEKFSISVIENQKDKIKFRFTCERCGESWYGSRTKNQEKE